MNYNAYSFQDAYRNIPQIRAMSMANKAQLARQTKALIKNIKQSTTGNVNASVSNIYLPLLCRLNQDKIQQIRQANGGKGQKAQRAVMDAVSKARKYIYDSIFGSFKKSSYYNPTTMGPTQTKTGKRKIPTAFYKSLAMWWACVQKNMGNNIVTWIKGDPSGIWNSAMSHVFVNPIASRAYNQNQMSQLDFNAEGEEGKKEEGSG